MKQMTKNFWQSCKNVLKSVWEVCSRHWVLKILSIIFAILIWNYVLAQTNPNRIVRVSDIGLTVQNESVLTSNGLILSESAETLLEKIWVSLEVPLDEVNRASSSVTAWIDLRNITQAGTVTVPINVATSTSGTVITKSMDSVRLQVEKLESKVFPVDLVYTGTLTDGYYVENYTINPMTVTVRGPASLLDTIDKAFISIPLHDLAGDYFGIHSVMLADADGNIISDSQLSVTNKDSVNLRMTVYLQRTMEVLLDDALIGTDEIAEGYELVSVETKPVSVSVYGNPDSIASMTGVPIAPVDVKGLSSDQIIERNLKLPGGVYCAEMSSVDVIIRVAEKVITKTIQDVQVRYSRLPLGYRLESTLPSTVSVEITGPEKIVQNMKAASVIVSADLSTCTAGENTVELVATVNERYEVTDIKLQPEVLTVAVIDTLKENTP